MKAKPDIVDLGSVQECTVLYSLFTQKYAMHVLYHAYKMIKLALVSEISISIPGYYAETYFITPATCC
jgi:hypothetical protein